MLRLPQLTTRTMKRMPLGWIILLLLLGCLCHANAGAAVGMQEKRLLLLFTGDLHSQVLPRRLSGDPADGREVGGYARLAGRIREAVQRYDGETLVVDAGDFSMGTVFHTLFRSKSLELRLMGAMGYEVTTLGNHDFDFLPDGLARSLVAALSSGERLPRIVAANVVFSTSDTRDRSLREAFLRYPVVPYTVVEKGGFRIGIFGLLGKDAQVDAPFARPITFSDAMSTAKELVARLRREERVDVILCLSHSGISGNPKHSEDELLARAVPEIDVIVSGHTHSVLPEPLRIGQTVIGAAGSYGNDLGAIELLLKPNERPTLLRYELLPVTETVAGDPVVASKIRSAVPLVDRDFLSVYGMYFGQVLAESPDDFPTLESTYEHPGETGLGDLITDAFRQAIHQAEGVESSFVHIAIQPLGNIRDRLLRGPVHVEDVFRVLSLGLGPDGMPGYPLITVFLDGSEVKRLLEVETTISRLKRDAHLQVSGVRFRYNPHRLPFDRVTDILVESSNGTWQPPVADRLYRVALNSYTAQMVDYVSRVSHGLLVMTPKRADGTPMTDWKEGIVFERSRESSGEIKEWIALARYLGRFSDEDRNGVPDIPPRYLKPEGRIQVEPSWNPLKLIYPAGKVTLWTVCGIGSVFGVSIGIVWFKRRKGMRDSKTSDAKSGYRKDGPAKSHSVCIDPPPCSGPEIPHNRG